MFKQVDGRAKLLLKGIREVDPLVDHVLDNPLPEEVTFAVNAIAKDKVQRMYVESCLLATTDLTEIAELLEIPESILAIFRDLYFDVVNLTKLEKLSIIHACKDATDQQMKMWAISQGVNFIKWRLGKQVNVSPVDGLSALFSDSFYKSKEAFFNPNSSISSREGLRWSKQAMDLAKLLKSWVMDSEEATKDIEIALQSYIGDEIEFPNIDELIEEETNGSNS